MFNKEERMPYRRIKTKNTMHTYESSYAQPATPEIHGDDLEAWREAASRDVGSFAVEAVNNELIRDANRRMMDGEKASTVANVGEATRAVVDDIDRQRSELSYAYAQDAHSLVAYDTREALAIVQSSETTAKDANAIIGSLAQALRHESNTNRYPDSVAPEITYSQRMLPIIQSVPVETLRALNELDATESGAFRYVASELLAQQDPGSLHGRAAARQLRGFSSFYEQHQAVRSGEARADAFYDELDTIVEPDKAGLYGSRAVEFLQEFGFAPVDAITTVQAMRGRITLHDKTTVNPYLLHQEMTTIRDTVSELGVDTLDALRQTCGIVNVSQYSTEQLGRMARYVDADPGLLGEMEQGDVAVVFRDATSDWNGAFESIGELYEASTSSTTVLFFEIASMRDQAQQLKAQQHLIEERGTKPSVLVIAGHGAPGKIKMGDGAIAIRSEDGVSLKDIGLGGMIANMQPDRDGNCTIIFESCSQAKSMGDRDDTTLIRTAEIAQASKPEGSAVHVYGLAEDAGMALNNGVLSAAKKDLDLSRVTVGRYGTVTSTGATNASILPYVHQSLEAHGDKSTVGAGL